MTSSWEHMNSKKLSQEGRDPATMKVGEKVVVVNSATAIPERNYLYNIK